MLYIPKLTEAEAKKGLLPDSEAGSIFSNKDDNGRFYRVTEEREVELIGGSVTGLVKSTKVDLTEQEFQGVGNGSPVTLVGSSVIPVAVALKKTSNSGTSEGAGATAGLQLSSDTDFYSFGDFSQQVFESGGAENMFFWTGEGSVSDPMDGSSAWELRIAGSGSPSSAPSVSITVWYIDAEIAR